MEKEEEPESGVASEVWDAADSAAWADNHELTWEGDSYSNKGYVLSKPFKATDSALPMFPKIYIQSLRFIFALRFQSFIFIFLLSLKHLYTNLSKIKK